MPESVVFCNLASTVDAPTGDFLNWHCPRCGSYRLTGSAEAIIKQKPIERFGTVSGWICQQNAVGITPTVSDVDALRSLGKPPFRERAERYLLAAVAKAPNLNTSLVAAAQDLIGASYSEDDGDVSVIRQYFQDEGIHQFTGRAAIGGLQRKDLSRLMIFGQYAQRLHKRL